MHIHDLHQLAAIFGHGGNDEAANAGIIGGNQNFGSALKTGHERQAGVSAGRNGHNHDLSGTESSSSAKSKSGNKFFHHLNSNAARVDLQ